jgi:hypothetical protein
LRRPASEIALSESPITSFWMVWTGALAPDGAASAGISSQARARNPAATMVARISAGLRRKLVLASLAHMTGKMGGWTGPAIGSWIARRPPSRSTR